MEASRQLVLTEDVTKSIDAFVRDFERIPEEKLHRLNDLSIYISSKLKSKNEVKILLACPFDDNVGEIGRIWAKIAVLYNNLDQIKIYSGSVLSPKISDAAIEALRTCGLEIKKIKSTPSPVFSVKFSDNFPAIKLIGKRIDHPDNPRSDFVAVILNNRHTKSPSIFTGADFRLPIYYDDPGGADKADKYLDLCRQIGADMFYMFSETRKSV